MAQELFHTGGGGACSTMSSCWWNSTNCSFDVVPPPPFLCSTSTAAIRDLDQLINGNQPSFLPMIDDSEEYSSVNPLEEAFLPGFFEPPAVAEPVTKKVVLSYQDHDHHESLLQSSSSSSWFMNPAPHEFLEVPNFSNIIPKQQQQQQQVVSNLCNNKSSTSTDQLWEPNYCTNFTPTPTQISVEPIKCSMTKGDHIGSEPPAKKPRIGMLSPLPTFKVRKEKLGDRVTALQQLVSPFGKTDTASVLHEAIEYIKFLHDQVGVLTSPYLENGHHHMQTQSSDQLRRNNGRSDEEDITNRDLRSRGLCLVPISSTFAFASECPMDFWAPNYGGSYI